MDRGLAGARLKIKRAETHIADIEARMAGLPDAYDASIATNPKTGHRFIKYDLADTSICIDLALMIGDAVHNLKCALDHAWITTLERFSLADITKTKFPVCPTSVALKRALRSAKIDVAKPSLFNLMVSQIKPYEGGNHDLWIIHRLDILDKHRLLIPLVNEVGIEGIEFGDQQGNTISKGGTPAITQPPPFYIPITDGCHVKDKGQVTTANVIFNEGTCAYGLEVADTLSHFSRVVTQAIDFLEDVSD